MTDAEARVLIAREIQDDAKIICSTVPEVDAARLTTALVGLSNRILDRYIAFLFTDTHPHLKGVPN